MDIIEAFIERVKKPTEQKLKEALEKLKNDEMLRRKIRELSNTTRDINRLEYGLQSFDPNSEIRGKWTKKKGELRKKQDKMYSDIQLEGFEESWIQTLIDNEIDKLEKLFDEARNAGYMEVFGKLDISDIDIEDGRWELIGKIMEETKGNYVEGK
ncbi:hypothetical protein [Mesobacillus stamsii]|uniref:Uncharacterized protein n=1 Tax=Mesobacillus stamsii TaxID=225347 RepID=A0ABU0FYH2_9BACI|nr:hypothetical protein [Mesobacillus stamsii]MDQ0414994.1 hypothetical protein [Mesobacillus stamsii]